MQDPSTGRLSPRVTRDLASPEPVDGFPLLRAPSAPTPSGTFGTLPQAECLAVLRLLSLALLLRIVYVWAWRVDTDEPQHLHVAWCWAQGLVPYRDFFDNHAPLFHVLMAPLVAAVGETPRILLLARFAMFPLYGLTLWAAFSVGRSLFGARAGAWAAVLLALHREFFLTSLETRTDDLWTALWWAGMAVLVGGSWSPRRGVLAGLLMGAATCTSLKTLLQLGALALGSGLAFSLLPRDRRPASFSATARRTVLPVLAGALVAPALVTAYLLARGAGPEMVSCLFTHSHVPGDGPALGAWGAGAVLVGSVGIAARLAWRLARSDFAPGDRGRQLVVLLGSAFHAAVLYGLWPWVTSQDSLPIEAAAAVLEAPVAIAVVAWAARATAGARPRTSAALPVVALLFASCVNAGRILYAAPPTGDGLLVASTYVADVLRLTEPGEPVMDPKGESIFRPRPVYLVLERFTNERIARGLIPDPVPGSVLATRTSVVRDKLTKYSPATAAFLRAEYVSVGSVRVLGRLWADGARADVPARFDLGVPSRYAILAQDGKAFEGTLDGAPYAGPVELAAGAHTLVSAGSRGPLAVLWARAVERGFTPAWPEGGRP